VKFWEAIRCLEEGAKVRCVRWDKSSFWDKSNLDDDVKWSDCAHRINKMMDENWELHDDV
jgi:hypothetical protein